MRWDIDKAITGLVASPLANASVARVMVSRAEALEAKLGPLTAAEEAAGFVDVWRLRVGLRDHHLSTYGRTIHGAYLRARRTLRSLSPDAAELRGLRVPKKRKPTR